MNKLFVDIDKSFGTVQPELHSQFIEVLGSCIYDGIWVGEDSPIEHIHGIRKDFVDALREIQPPLIRWPGGCSAPRWPPSRGTSAGPTASWQGLSTPLWCCRPAARWQD